MSGISENPGMRPGGRRLRMVLCTAVALVSVNWSGSAHADEAFTPPESPVPSEVESAVIETMTATGTLTASTIVESSTDANSAAVSTASGVTLDVPRDADAPVTVNGIQITPPAAPASSPDEVVPLTEGVVASQGPAGTLNTVAQHENGTVQFTNVILDPSATETYPYRVATPDGGSVELTPDGGAVIYDSAMGVVATVAKPWATTSAASGSRDVSTYFTVDGNRLVQHVNHRGLADSDYPVQSDPVLAVVAAIAANCAFGAVTGLIGRLGWSAVWQSKFTYKFTNAIEDCVDGVIWGPVLKWVPAPVKRAMWGGLRDGASRAIFWLTGRRF